MRHTIPVGECNSNPQDGKIYTCSSLDCPVHGKRNVEWHMRRFYPTLEEIENHARNQRPIGEDRSSNR
jgi:hypothetical protein